MQKPIFVKNIARSTGMLKIEPEEVALLESSGNYTKIIFFNKGYLKVRANLAATLKKLPADMFVRVHRQYAVSLLYLDNFTNDHFVIEFEVQKETVTTGLNDNETAPTGTSEKGTELVRKIEKEIVPIGRSYYKGLLAKVVVIE